MRLAFGFILILTSARACLGADNWTMANPWPTSNSLSAVVWTGSLFVAAGARGTVLTSKTGSNWNYYRITDAAGDAVDIYSITCSQKTLVAAGNVPGVVWSSSDGVLWSRVSLGFSAEIRKLIWTGKEFAGIALVTEAVTGGSRAHFLFVSSPDGLHWTSVPFEISGRVALLDVAWTGRNYVVVGARQTDWNDRLNYLNALSFSRVVRTNTQTFSLSSVNGNKWDFHILADSESPEALGKLIWNGSRMIAIGVSGSIFSSAEGISWKRERSLPTLPEGGSILKVIWDGREIIAMGDIRNGRDPQQSEIITSQDGISWTFHALAPSDLRSVNDTAWTGSQYVSVGDGGLIQSSPDLEHWTLESPTGRTKGLSKIISNGSMFVAVGGDAVLTSVDAHSWKLTKCVGLNGESITWTGSRFITVGKEGSISTSFDAKHWTTQTIAGLPWFHDLISTGKQIVAVGAQEYGSGMMIFTSVDGLTWKQEKLPDGLLGALYCVIWTGTELVAVGDDSTVLTSLDGHDWKMVHSDQSLPLLYGISFSGKKFVAVGVNISRPSALISNDGVSWNSVSLPIVRNLYSVVWTGKQFVAVGDMGEILSSSDGNRWKYDIVPTEATFRNVITTGDKIVTVGEDGVVLISTNL